MRNSSTSTHQEQQHFKNPQEERDPARQIPSNKITNRPGLTVLGVEQSIFHYLYTASILYLKRKVWLKKYDFQESLTEQIPFSRKLDWTNTIFKKAWLNKIPFSSKFKYHFQESLTEQITFSRKFDWTNTIIPFPRKFDWTNTIFKNVWLNKYHFQECLTEQIPFSSKFDWTNTYQTVM